MLPDYQPLSTPRIHRSFRLIALFSIVVRNINPVDTFYDLIFVLVRSYPTLINLDRLLRNPHLASNGHEPSKRSYLWSIEGFNGHTTSRLASSPTQARGQLDLSSLTRNNGLRRYSEESHVQLHLNDTLYVDVPLLLIQIGRTSSVLRRFSSGVSYSRSNSGFSEIASHFLIEFYTCK